METFIECCAWDTIVHGAPEITDVGADEKLGKLRLYYAGGDRRTDAYAAFVGQLSEKICEECGRPNSGSAENGFNAHACEEHR